MDPEQHFQNALRLHQNNHLNQARDQYHHCLSQNPRHLFALINLGSVYRRLGLPEKALKYLEKAIRVAPEDPSVHYNHANALRDAGRLENAIAAYRQAIRLNPENAGYHYNLGMVLEMSGKYNQALESYGRAMEKDPDHLDARINYAALETRSGHVSAALAVLTEILKKHPGYAPALNNMAMLCQDIGQADKALSILQKAVQVQPDLAQPRSNLLMGLQYHAGITAAGLLTHARNWGAWAMARAEKNIRDPLPFHAVDNRPLRLGYVSADFCMHPVGLFVKDVVAAHDLDKFTPVLYNNGSRKDDVFLFMAQSVQTKGGWVKDIRGMDDAAVAKQIQDDKIDILIDLSGHTGKSRLSVFALRPALVQITWLGYFATTGLETMDFVILDPYHAPEGTEAWFTERIIRLPHNRFCYSPVSFAPDVSVPPSTKNRYITFGSFNNTAKLSQDVLSTWAQILKAVPNSRLILKWRTFADDSFCNRTREFFSSKGIDTTRLELRSMSGHKEMLDQYADLDIALDPFPFSGGHTSCEALWMGVPVITMPQDRVVSRQTWSFLNNIGLPGLAAPDKDKYIDLAVNLAQNRALLENLRSGLRDRMRNSPLCQVNQFTRHLESAFDLAWNTRRKDAAFAAAQKGVRLRDASAPAERRIQCYREAFRLAPEEAIYAANLASALSDAGNFTEAEKMSRTAIRLAPERYEPWYNLGTALSGQNQYEAAARSFDKAARLSLTASVYQAAGNAWHKAKNGLNAARRYREALNTMDKSSSRERGMLLSTLGETLESVYHYSEALAAYRQALEIFPDDPRILTNLGNTLKALGRYEEALVCYEKTRVLCPDAAGAYSNPGTVYQAKGDTAQAIQYYQKALQIDPAMVAVWSNLAAAMTYSPTHTPADTLTALQRFDAQVARSLINLQPHDNEHDKHKRLRIGYVSPDFRKHVVAYFALPLVEGHRGDQVEVFCYYNHRQEDNWTEAFRSASDHWCNCAGMTDEALAKQIREDRIDILVDLAGHTENNRLLVFAGKPAPIQVTWMGYVTTTGMSAMDWRITHQDADPEEAQTHYTEKLYRLAGTMWCFRPLPDMPEVSTPPFQKNGVVTFGSFNRYSKNSQMVLDTWAKILKQVPDSRLLICVPEGEIRQQMAQFFNERGVDPSRIDCFAKVSHADFWHLHARVDIALDPFPFGGGTTTCETLWMGVPLITCTGRVGGDFEPRFASRMGYAFLNNIGLPELASDTLSGYIDKAVALAGDPDRMTELRNTLRDKMANAPLTDETRFVKEMEAAFRFMWQDWIDTCSPKDAR